MKLSSTSSQVDDVRMRGFKQRSPVDDIISWLDQQSIHLQTETINIQDACGRILAEDITSNINIPSFSRSMMDGYAIKASDAQGASSYNQLQLEIVGKSMPGQGADVAVKPGQTVRIMTGAPLPNGADAVLPAENVEFHDDHIFIMESVAQGRNIGQPGEDIKQGHTVLQQGRRLRPQDIALLASIGYENIAILQRPRIKIIVTGNELLPVGSTPQGFQIVNSNGPMLEALARRDGADAGRSDIIKDNPEQLRDAMLSDCDVLLLTGGTSVGEEDFVPLLLAELGELTFHGVTMRPSRSTGFGKIGDTLVFLLPGNPVACLCAYDFFAGRTIRRFAGLLPQWPYPVVRKKLKHKISSIIGRTDYARVRRVDDQVESVSVSGAANISSTTVADGFVIIAADSEGYPAQADVDVFLYELPY